MRERLFVMMTCGVLLVPAVAAGQATAQPGAPPAGRWFANAAVGAAFAGRIEDSPRGALAASLGWVDPDVTLGWEVHLERVSDFFQLEDVEEVVGSSFNKSGVTTLMFNATHRPEMRPFGERLRPYVSAGLGLVRVAIGGDTEDSIRTRRNHLGLNLGGGVEATLHERWGASIDLRYTRDLQDLEDEDFFLLQDEEGRPVQWFRVAVGVHVRF
jgi:opacity protein-like surface antigen